MNAGRGQGIALLILAAILTPPIILWCIPWYGLVRSPLDFWFNVSCDVAVGVLLAALWGIAIYAIVRAK